MSRIQRGRQCVEGRTWCGEVILMGSAVSAISVGVRRAARGPALAAYGSTTRDPFAKEVRARKRVAIKALDSAVGI